MVRLTLATISSRSVSAGARTTKRSPSCFTKKNISWWDLSCRNTAFDCSFSPCANRRKLVALFLGSQLAPVEDMLAEHYQTGAGRGRPRRGDGFQPDAHARGG